MRPPPAPPGRPLPCTLLALALATLAAGSRPGCPPPISRFLSYPARVTVPRVAPVKVATLSFAENSYFGSARCSLVQDLRDTEQTLLSSFRLEEAELVEAGAAVKQCSIYLVNDKIAETVLNVEVILIVSLNEGYKRFCESNSLISSTANIEISFCDPDVCLDKAKDWEIVENVISFKAGRSVDGDTNTLTRTLEVTGTGDQEVVVEAASEPPEAEAEAGSVAVGKEPDPDVNKKILLGLTLVVTLIALSLVLGLIYFWCPALCCCMRAAPRGEASLDTTKILTVRDAEGRVLEAARSVEVWKTEANKIKTLEVLDSIVRPRERRRRKHRRYSHLLHTTSGSGASSNFFSDPETTRGGEAEARAGMKVISVGESLDGVIILRPGHGGRVAVLEQLDPRRLRRLSFSRHYSAGSGRGTPASTQRHVR